MIAVADDRHCSLSFVVILLVILVCLVFVSDTPHQMLKVVVACQRKKFFGLSWCGWRLLETPGKKVVMAVSFLLLLLFSVLIG